MERLRPWFTPAKAMAVSLLSLVCLAKEERSSVAWFSNWKKSSRNRYKERGWKHGGLFPQLSLVQELPLIHKKVTGPTSRRLKKERIIGGTPAPEGEYPFYAFPRGMMLCGATLISPEILLTAAHCGGVWTTGALIGKKHCYLLDFFFFSFRLILVGSSLPQGALRFRVKDPYPLMSI